MDLAVGGVVDPTEPERQPTDEGVTAKVTPALAANTRRYGRTL
jgi:hypothetical protein